jgi:hypothetical protein
MFDTSSPINRATFLKSLGALFALTLLDRRSPPQVAMMGMSLKHPDPRPDITAEHVKSAADLGKFAERPKVMAAYDEARAWPEIFDGLACGCGCTGESATHRSLLSCYESMQPTGCQECRDEANFVAKMAKDKKTLAEIRTAVDKEFG